MERHHAIGAKLLQEQDYEFEVLLDETSDHRFRCLFTFVRVVF
jgi:hypothetical protein